MDNGPFVIGYTLCFGLMGALAVQSYIYFTRFTDDQKAIKTLVTVVLLLETLMTALVFSGFWLAVVSWSPVPQGASFWSLAPQGTQSSFLVLAVIAGLVTTLTQGFYCWRLVALQKYHLFTLPIMMISLFQFAASIYFGYTNDFVPGIAYAHVSKSLYQAMPGAPLWLVLWLGSSLVCDLAITICMIISLRPSKSRFSSNKSVLVRLTRLTIETGLVTTVASLLELVLGILYPDSWYHVAVFYAISKLYANCLLASLNFRLVLRSKSDPSQTAIVWDDEGSNIQPGKPFYQQSHIVQIQARVEPNVVICIGPNETSTDPRKNSFVESGM